MAARGDRGVNAAQPSSSQGDLFPMRPTEYGGDRGVYAGKDGNAPEQLTLDVTIGGESMMLGAMYRASDGADEGGAIDAEKLSKRVK